MLLEHRHGFVVGTTVSSPTGSAEIDQAIELCAAQPPRVRRRTLAADKGYDQRSFVAGICTMGWTPHVAQLSNSTLDQRTTRHPAAYRSVHRPESVRPRPK